MIVPPHTLHPHDFPIFAYAYTTFFASHAPPHICHQFHAGYSSLLLSNCVDGANSLNEIGVLVTIVWIRALTRTSDISNRLPSLIWRTIIQFNREPHDTSLSRIDSGHTILFFSTYVYKNVMIFYRGIKSGIHKKVQRGSLSIFHCPFHTQKGSFFFPFYLVIFYLILCFGSDLLHIQKIESTIVSASARSFS